VRVVVFHDVEDKDWFEKVVSLFASRYHIITPEDFHTENFNPSKINLLLTFDDGYQTWMDNVLPVLKANDISGLFFVCSGLLDAAENKKETRAFMRKRLMVNPKEALSWKEARELIEYGHTIGGHTVSHANLAELKSKELIREILDDKKRIESELDIELKDFAYPFGAPKHINRETTHIVASAGYTYAYTAISSFVVKDSGASLQIPRMCFERNQDLRHLHTWVEGAYDIFSALRIYTQSDSRNE
jgi:peptidoglycan/xylan/chitin deacetylase (PgdA/CDA1 family)